MASHAHLLRSIHYDVVSPPTPILQNITLGTGTTYILGDNPYPDLYDGHTGAVGAFSIGGSTGTETSLVIPVGSNVVLAATVVYQCTSTSEFDITAYNHEASFELVTAEDSFDNNLSALPGTLQTGLVAEGEVSIYPAVFSTWSTLSWHYPLTLPSPGGVTNLFISLRATNNNTNEDRIVGIASVQLSAIGL